MYEQDGRSVELDRSMEQLAYSHEGARHVSLVEALLGDDDIAGVEDQDVEFFALEAPELNREAISDVARAANLPAGPHGRELEPTAAVRTARPGYGSVANEANGGARLGVRRLLGRGGNRVRRLG